jgi:hypothetical protein
MLNNHRDHISPASWGSSNITLHHDLAPYTPAEATQKEEMLSIFYAISAEITLYITFKTPLQQSSTC